MSYTVLKISWKTESKVFLVLSFWLDNILENLKVHM